MRVATVGVAILTFLLSRRRYFERCGWFLFDVSAGFFAPHARTISADLTSALEDGGVIVVAMVQHIVTHPRGLVEDPPRPS